MLKLIMIRHGQTTGDVEDRYGGAYDDDLSAEGRVQATQMARTLPSQGVQRIYTSPLRRAVQTAETLAAPLGCSIVLMDAMSGMTKE